MKVKKAFPWVFERRYPVVKPDYPLLTVLYLLRMKDIEAVPLAGRGAKAVFAFSALPQLLSLGPKGFANYLELPCSAASSILATVSEEDELGALLEAFESKRLGFASVQGGREETGLVGLWDVLGLYVAGSIRSEMRVEEVGTKIFSMPGTTSIREALHAMFRRRVRRVFLNGEASYISDRGITNYLFSPMRLGFDFREDEDMLSAPIAKVEKSMPAAIEPKTSLKSALLKLGEDRGGCLVTPSGEVVTPWDLVMKPWRSGKLVIKD